MSVNTLNFEQVSTVLTSIVQQATGQIVETPTDTGSFVSVAQVALRADRDAVMNAISNILTRTIFSIRPYSAKMQGLEMDTFRWGGMMRKLSIADSAWQDDPAFKYPVLFDSTQNPPTGDGGEVDPWKIKKPNILQTNFYGQSVYYDSMTITEDQLETAFTGPEQLGSFLSLLMTNLANRLEMSNESIRRGLVCNAIGALYDENNSDRVVHLLTEYKALTGLSSLTVQDVYKPDNFSAFTKWVYSRVAEITDLFTANSQMFQTVITGKPILRHTPLEDQRVYLYSPMQRQIEARVLADTFHDNFLRYSDVESLSYWQSIDTRDTVEVIPSYVDPTGTLVTPAQAVTVENVFGLIFDRDCMGMTVLDRRVLSTRVNEAGLYRNIHVHARQRVVFDNTEKACLLLLD